MDLNVAVKQLGVYSEVGPLREVLVHRPDLSLTRLTPGNCHELLFDDVIWVKQARQEHDAFVDTLRDRNVIVHEFGAMLTETMADPAARNWLLDRRADVAPAHERGNLLLKDLHRGRLEGFEHAVPQHTLENLALLPDEP